MSLAAFWEAWVSETHVTVYKPCPVPEGMQDGPGKGLLFTAKATSVLHEVLNFSLNTFRRPFDKCSELETELRTALWRS